MTNAIYPKFEIEMSQDFSSSSGLKHKAVFQFLKNKILSGQFLPGDQLPTEKNLVAKFGHSRPTIARALNDLEAEGLIHRQAGAGSFVAHLKVRKDQSAKSLGLIVPGLAESEVFESICGQIAFEAEKREISLLWGLGPESRGDIKDRIIKAVRHFADVQVDGVFFSPLAKPGTIEQDTYVAVTDLCSHAGIPVVLLNRDIYSYPKRSPYDLISMDCFRSGFSVGAHLLKCGIKRLFYFLPEKFSDFSKQRISGVKLAIDEMVSGEEFKFEIFSGDSENVDFVASCLSGLLNKNKFTKTGLICDSDFTASLLLKSLNRLKTKVPENFVLASFDNADFSSLLQPSLTTYAAPGDQMGIAAFEVMMSRIESPHLPARHVMLTGELVVRESSKR